MKPFAISCLLLPALLQDPVKDRLDASPRHHEWIQLKVGDRTLQAFVVFPEVKEKSPAIVVIHENKGLSDWVRSAADQFAEAGVIAIAPDHLSGLGPNGGKTSDFPTVDAATQALYKLPPDQVTADLNACADYVSKLDACNGKVAVGGFCWGGGQTFRFATHRDSLVAALVFYGPAPEDPAAIARIRCPVHGFYGENDARINAGIEKTAAAMKEAGKSYDPVIYKGAGHGFMRAGEMAGAKDDERKARADAWARIREILKKL
ncbi:MAG TPA: dienelactone hydrolase family protein [Planctomycetota bacterium]|nr:dienelactone hydrolase family protein [Planctomycetota bacterium]